MIGTILISAVVILATSVLARWGQVLAERWLAPKLEMRYHHSTHGRVHVEANGHNTVHVRINVTNSKRRMARNCRAYLADLEKRIDGEWRRLLWDTVQLRWSSLWANGSVFEVDVPHDVTFRVDLFNTVEGDIHFSPLAQMPNYYKPESCGEYRFTVVVTAEGATTVRKQFTLRCDRDWQNFEFDMDRSAER